MWMIPNALAFKEVCIFSTCLLGRTFNLGTSLISFCSNSSNVFLNIATINVVNSKFDCHD